MTEFIGKVNRNGQFTLPSKIRKILHIKEGDLFRFEIKDNKIILTPVSVVDKSQVYFFSKKWQKSIQESEKDIKKGKYSVYHSAEELKKDIENE